MSRRSPAHVFYVVFVLPANPQLHPNLPRRTYFTCLLCFQPPHSYAQTFTGTRILRAFRASSHLTATPRHSPADLFYVAFVIQPPSQLRPDLPRRMYFTWFSCFQPFHSYTQTFPGTRILRGFRASRHPTVTPRPSPAHVFY